MLFFNGKLIDAGKILIESMPKKKLFAYNFRKRKMTFLFNFLLLFIEIRVKELPNSIKNLNNTYFSYETAVLVGCSFIEL